jgi:hypothetical protein
MEHILLQSTNRKSKRLWVTRGTMWSTSVLHCFVLGLGGMGEFCSSFKSLRWCVRIDPAEKISIHWIYKMKIWVDWGYPARCEGRYCIAPAKQMNENWVEVETMEIIAVAALMPAAAGGEEWRLHRWLVHHGNAVPSDAERDGARTSPLGTTTVMGEEDPAAPIGDRNDLAFSVCSVLLNFTI